MQPSPFGGLLSRPSDLDRLGDVQPGALFVTGRAGTGKSTLLREFVQHSGLHCAVLAPTGLAALNVGGQTIHSFFRIKPGPVLADTEHVPVFKQGHPRWRLIKMMDVLVIDEISMVRADLLDAIDFSLRANMRSDEPFGGKRVLFFGDLLQLEPVVKRGAEMEMMLDLYASPFFFDAKVLRNFPMDILELTEVHRQAEDPEFLWALNELRQGKTETLDLINERVGAPLEGRSITLHTRNAGVFAMNMDRLSRLEGASAEFRATFTGEAIEDTPTDSLLTLKLGARVMFVRNGTEWVNGTLGTVVGFPAEGGVRVLKDDEETVTVGPETWEKVRWTWDGRRHKIAAEVTGTFTQIPLKLAWALTVHKSQGLTFDRVRLDFSGGAFAHGQLYVALSRCRSLKGLSLSHPLKPTDLIFNERVVEFWGQTGLL